jgi:YidC/Oxa1 family membrane protein insertase
MSILFGIPVDLAYHLVCWLAVLLAPLLGGLAAVAAIIAFTMLVRLALLPLSYFGFRGEGARARLQPQVRELQQRHAGHPQRQQQELAALYRAEGTSMFAGFLPMLLQVPFFSLMYRLFVSRSVGGSPNTLLTHRLLGAPLGSHWLAGAGAFSAHGAVFAILFALLAVVAGLAVRSARRGSMAAETGPGGRAVGVASRVMPFASVVMAAVLPLAAGLYLLTTAAWTLAERAVLRRRFPPVSPLPAAPLVSGAAGRRGPCQWAPARARRARRRSCCCCCPTAAAARTCPTGCSERTGWSRRTCRHSRSLRCRTKR